MSNFRETGKGVTYIVHMFVVFRIDEQHWTRRQQYYHTRFGRRQQLIALSIHEGTVSETPQETRR